MRWCGALSTAHAGLLWALYMALLPSATCAEVTQSAGSQPLPLTPPNSTLLFDSAAHGSLRNCSCASEIQDCNDALANLLCSCRTVPRSSLPPAGLNVHGGLTVWVRDGWLLRELLNGSMVQDLRLSSCGPPPPAPPPAPSRYLALLGLRSLRVYVSGTAHPERALTIATATDEPAVGWNSSYGPLHVSFLDTALLSGLSSLKAYSVISPPAANLNQYFPHLPLPQALPHPQQDCLLTFIY